MNASIELLTQANVTLSKCGRKIYDPAQSAVLIPRSFMLQSTFAANTLQANQTITKEITGDAPWLMRAISATSSSTSGLSIQVKLPNGKFLMSNLQDLLQFAGYGSYRYLMGRELECPPGSQLQLTLQDTSTSILQPVAILFEGAYKYALKGVCNSNMSPLPPRIHSGPNQNILAPCWMQGYGPRPPAGCSQSGFTYISNQGVATAVPLSAPYSTVAVQIDRDSDFFLRRIFFQVTADNTVLNVGRFLCRPRSGNGYELANDYIDLNLYLGGAPFAKDWHVAAGDQIFFDLALVDAVGSGNQYITIYLEGTKVKRQ